MSTSDEFQTFGEIDSNLEFIQPLENLESGSLATSTGINRSLQRLARNTDALFDVQSAERQTFVTGGGTITWSSGTGALTRSSDMRINFPHVIAGASYNAILAATAISLAADGEVAYVVFDRGTTAAPLAVATAADMGTYRLLMDSAADRLDYQIVAYRDGTDIILWDGRRLRDGFSITNNGYTQSQYGQQTEITTVHDNQKENFRLMLTGGGTVSWDESTATLTWDTDFTLEFPSAAGNNTIPATSEILAAGEALSYTLTRQPGGSSSIAGTKSIDASGSVSNADNVVVLAYHNAVDGRLYLYDGTALSDGESVLLGGVRSGVQWFYQKAGVGLKTDPPDPANEVGGTLQYTDFTEAGTFPNRVYRVGSHDLMVYRGGIKAKASTAYWSGVFPLGALLNGPPDLSDQYLEEDQGSGEGTRIVWLRDNNGDLPAGHADGAHTPAFTWPSSAEIVEGFIGLQGEGPSPVESWGIQPEPGGGPLEGAVKLKEGTGVTLSYDIPTNSVQIDISATAGVSSLQDPDGPAALRTGVLKLRGGTKITLDNVSNTDEFVFNNDVENLANLDDVSVDLSASITGAGASPVGTNAPDASNVLATIGDVLDLIFGSQSPLVGFDQTRIVATAARIARGALIIEGIPYPTTSAVVVNQADILSTETVTSDEWHYMYLGAGASAGSPPIGYLSTEPPGADGQHPTESPPIRFICSTYVGSVGGDHFHRGLKRGNWVDLEEPVNITAGAAIDTNGETSVSLGNLKGVPTTSSSVKIRVTLRMRTIHSFDYVQFGWEGDLGGGAYKYWTLPFVADATATFEFIVVPTTAAYSFDVDTAPGGISSVEAVEVVGYSEGVFSAADNTWV